MSSLAENRELDAIDALAALVELGTDHGWTTATREWCDRGAALATDVEHDPSHDRNWFLDRRPP